MTKKVIYDDEGELSEETIRDIAEARKDIKKGRIYTFAEAKKRYDLK